MTLYGSPKYLFVLYALAVCSLLVIYFVLCYVYQPAADYEDYGSYISGPTGTEITEDRRTGRTRRTASTGESSRHHGLRNTAFLGAGLAGLAALRRRSQSRNARRGSRTKTASHRSYPSESYVEEEKVAQSGAASSNKVWKTRLLGAGAGLGAYEGLKRVFSRRRPEDEESFVSSSYVQATGGGQPVNRADVIRVQDGQAPSSPDASRINRTDRVAAAVPTTPTRQGLRSRTSRDSFSSYDSRSSFEEELASRPAEGVKPGLMSGVASLGLFGYVKEKRRQRQAAKDDARIEVMRQHEQDNAERINRAGSRRYNDRSGHRRPSVANTEATQDPGYIGSNPELSRRYHQSGNVPPLPASAATLPTSNQYSTTHLPTNDQPSNLAAATSRPAYPMSAEHVSMPEGAVQPDAFRLARPNSTSRTHIQDEMVTAGLAGGAAGLAAADLAHSPARSDRHERPAHHRNPGSHARIVNSPTSIASPPVSVKVKMHNDGRHVTLRRLNEDEAAAEHEARRRERRHRRRRAESLSSGVEDEGTRYRRHQTSVSQTNTTARPPTTSQQDELNLPPSQGPPPVPVHSAGMSPSNIVPSGLTSGVGSPGTYDTGTGTELSAFDTNRRRRRAERAALRNANQGARVEFS